ncbi:helix-turn-helix domain-containing protein [Hamadaea tsunoensis]|uniref:helix-turn-helix domain-containing protein n=1 Tax=Hamadaea tsunoensis TaxID=53368 RepID=UPI00146FBC7D|nr:helix-turn-helix domain-containing protein [Hamadaea tsunoensis]
MSIPLQFGGVLRHWRKRRGVTQQQLADLSTVSVRAIRDLEMGRVAQPRQDTVRLICDGLGLTGRARAEFHAAATRPDDAPDWWHEPPDLPPAYDRLIGRTAELADLGEALAGGQRLTALVGVAGVGKTRLALEVAADCYDRYRLPVLWSAYAGPPANPTVTLIRAALGAGVAPVAAVSAADQLGAVIGDRDAVIVCDGYDASTLDVAALTGLLRACRGLRIVVTSRTPIPAGGVFALPLAPLPVPPDGLDPAALREIDSVRLLLHHARRSGAEPCLSAGNADTVAALCRRLDGLPAALAGAASWLLFYDPAALLDRVEADPFAVIGEPATGSELRGALRTSVRDLPPQEQALLAALTDLGGTFSISRAATVAGLPAQWCARLARNLSVRGLLRPQPHPPGTEPRFAVPFLVRHAAQTAGDLPGQPPMIAAARS